VPTTGILTSTAATLAAVLSAISLVLTRRWQRRDLEQERLSKTRMWVLGSLKEALIDHINLSFKISRVCQEAVAARKINDLVLIDEIFSRAVDLHIEYMDLMVYLRLLSTPNIVLSAERLHLSLDWLLDLTFSEQVIQAGRKPFAADELPPGLTVMAARAAGMENRERLINDAREYLGLPRDAAINPGTRHESRPAAGDPAA
jgi:hypothetical protein